MSQNGLTRVSPAPLSLAVKKLNQSRTFVTPKKH
jgi:hypothetical protein